MKTYICVLLSLLFITSCCRIIKPKGQNISIEVRLTDNLLTDPANCDGWIRFVNPGKEGATVKYKWSHDAKHSEYEASNLCSGLYKITVTKNSISKVKQVIIN